jgi:putative acetyltransferase
MEVRRAVHEDAEALRDLVLRSITVTGATAYDSRQIESWSTSFTKPHLESIIASSAVFIVEVDGRVGGFANLIVTEAGRAEVDLLYVDPDVAGRGVARRAVEAAEAEARRRGIDHLWADASLLAAPLFEHLGYVVEERYEKRRGAETFRNTWLSKDL